MGAALAFITVGAWLVYSSLKGEGLAEVFTNAGAKLNPKGGDFTPAAPPAASTPDSPTPAIGSPGDKSLRGTQTIDGHPVAAWIARRVIYARTRKNWGGQVLSGVRSTEEQRQACIHVCGNPNGCPGTCAKPGTSNHRGIIFPLGAVDVSDPAGFEQAIADYPGGAHLIGNGHELPNDVDHFSFTGR